MANFITAKLQANPNTNNYNSWKEQILCLVDSQGLLPYLINDPLHQIALRAPTDRLLKAWILGSVSDEIVKRVFNCKNTRDVWLALEQMFTVMRRQEPEQEPRPSRPNNAGNSLWPN